MADIELSKVGWEDDSTQFRIEQHPEGLWSGGPEIRILHELNGKKSQYGPSIPIDLIDDLVLELLKAKKNLSSLQKD